MYYLSTNTRIIVGTCSGLISIGLGYFIYRNYRHYLLCDKHCDHFENK